MKKQLSEEQISESGSDEGEQSTKPTAKRSKPFSNVPSQTPSPSSSLQRQAASRSPVKKKNASDEVYFDLSSKRRVTIRKWNRLTLVDLREFWDAEDSESGEGLKPGKKGISLSLEQWTRLKELAPQIDKAIDELK